jgi:site-specific DNA-methyltransferase (adenine-specific)
MSGLVRNRIIVGDALVQMRRLPAASVDCVVTSPPYYGLRDYQVAGQLGLEANVDQWVNELRAVVGEVARVLKPTGSLWLNIADSYSRHARQGGLPKSLLLGPERLLLALARDGWIVRNKAVWAKPNPMPSSVGDRLSATWESIYFLVRNSHYFFDLDAIRAPHRSQRSPIKPKPTSGRRPDWAGPLAGSNSGLHRLHELGLPGHPLGKNPGDVWTVATAFSRRGHHATFPEALIDLPTKATCPERVCTRCGRTWTREHVARAIGHLAVVGELRPACDCRAAWHPGVVLDPFIGSGTTAVVAERLGRDWLGIELNPDFVRIAEERIAAARGRPEARAA